MPAPALSTLRLSRLLYAFVVEGGVTVVTRWSDLAAAGDRRGGELDVDPDSIVVASMIQLDGSCVVRIVRPVAKPSVFPIVWALHTKRIHAALAPLERAEAWAEDFERWSARSSRAVSLLLATFAALASSSALGDAAPWSEPAATGWLVVAATSTFGALLPLLARRWLSRRLIAWLGKGQTVRAGRG